MTRGRLVINSERDAQIVALMRTPVRFLTLERIGQHYGISRERIRQVLAKAGVLERPRLHVFRQCVNCKNEVSTFSSKHCSACLTRIHAPILVYCQSCGAEILRSKGAYNAGQKQSNPLRHGKPQSRWFCNKICQGRWFGKNHGHGRPRKWTDEQLIAIRAAPAGKIRVAAASIGMPISSAYFYRSLGNPKSLLTSSVEDG